MTQPETTTDNTSTPETPETVTSSVIDLVRVQEVIDTLRPYLQADGGDCEIVDVTEDGIVKLRLHGACGTCPSSTYTLKMGIEEQLKQHIPGIREVQQVF